AVARLRAMVIQDDAQADLARIVDYLVEDLQRRETHKIGVDVRVVVGWDRVGLHHLVRERDADDVVAEALGGVENVLIAPRPKPVSNEIRGFKTVPVDARDPDRVAGGIDYTVAAGMPVTDRSGGIADRRSDCEGKHGDERGNFELFDTTALRAHPR